MTGLLTIVAYSIVGFVFGVAITALVYERRLRHQAQQDQADYDLNLQSQADLAEQLAEFAMLKRHYTELQDRDKALQEKVVALSAEKTRFETLYAEVTKSVTEQEERFEALCQKTLKRIKGELDAESLKTLKDKEVTIEKSVTNLLNPLKELIVSHEKKVSELEKQHVSETSSLNKQLEILVKETAKVSKERERLADALSNSKGRGDWGEMELARLLESSGLLPDVHFEMQKTQGGLRPDVTINLTNGRVLYVDAKTILVNLERLMGAETEEEGGIERKKHAAALEKEILSLNSKSYESKTEASIDFVVLFVPRESMLRVALEERPSLMDDAFNKGVILASPLVLMSILKVVAYGWNQETLSQNAREIQKIGQDLHRRAVTFLTRFEKLGDRIEAVSGQFDEARLSLTGRQGVMPQLKKMEELGSKSEKSLPDALVNDMEDALTSETEFDVDSEDSLLMQLDDLSKEVTSTATVENRTKK